MNNPPRRTPTEPLFSAVNGIEMDVSSDSDVRARLLKYNNGVGGPLVSTRRIDVGESLPRREAPPMNTSSIGGFEDVDANEAAELAEERRAEREGADLRKQMMAARNSNLETVADILPPHMRTSVGAPPLKEPPDADAHDVPPRRSVE